MGADPFDHMLLMTTGEAHPEMNGLYGNGSIQSQRFITFVKLGHRYVESILPIVVIDAKCMTA